MEERQTAREAGRLIGGDKHTRLAGSLTGQAMFGDLVNQSGREMT